MPHDEDDGHDGVCTCDIRDSESHQRPSDCDSIHSSCDSDDTDDDIQQCISEYDDPTVYYCTLGDITPTSCGARGFQGVGGAFGSRGPQGFQGIEGKQGQTGQTGQLGPQGYVQVNQVGFQGAQGPPGSNDVNGGLSANSTEVTFTNMEVTDGNSAVVYYTIANNIVFMSLTVPVTANSLTTLDAGTPCVLSFPRPVELPPTILQPCVVGVGALAQTTTAETSASFHAARMSTDGSDFYITFVPNGRVYSPLSFDFSFQCTYRHF